MSRQEIDDVVRRLSRDTSDLSPELATKVQALLLITELLWNAWVNVGKLARVEMEVGSRYVM